MLRENTVTGVAFREKKLSVCWQRHSEQCAPEKRREKSDFQPHFFYKIDTESPLFNKYGYVNKISPIFKQTTNYINRFPTYTPILPKHHILIMYGVAPIEVQLRKEPIQYLCFASPLRPYNLSVNTLRILNLKLLYRMMPHICMASGSS